MNVSRNKPFISTCYTTTLSLRSITEAFSVFREKLMRSYIIKLCRSFDWCYFLFRHTSVLSKRIEDIQTRTRILNSKGERVFTAHDWFSRLYRTLRKVTTPWRGVFGPA
ncbi:unnamed protein product [Ixodes persulcatus]